ETSATSKGEMRINQRPMRSFNLPFKGGDFLRTKTLISLPLLRDRSCFLPRAPRRQNYTNAFVILSMIHFRYFCGFRDLAPASESRVLIESARFTLISETGGVRIG